VEELRRQQQLPDFWKDQQNAQSVSRELKELEADVDFFDQIAQQLNDTKELVRLAMQEDDAGVLDDVEQELRNVERVVAKREKNLRFSGPHDRAGAILTIQSGAGGTDAQDWTEMLERMYLRFAEQREWQTHSLDRSAGEEAGIKHTTFKVEGTYAYGILKQEHGIHRLVRLSPFNADHLRQTSFARVEVIPQLSPAEAPVISPEDLQVDTFRAGGAGGQHVNKTSSAVRIRHLPTGIVVQCQNERSQGQNKAQALSVLQAKLVALAEEQRVAAITELRGPKQEAAWGNQIRSYVLHPYTLVKDHRTGIEESDVHGVLDGDLSKFVEEGVV
jgi:peptide chain release factor 2